MNLKVKDIMNNNIETISQEASVFEAMQKMISKK